MSTAMISSTGSQTILKPNLSTSKSFLAPSSNLSFNTHFTKSSFPLKSSNSKSIKTSPIKAAMANPIYVDKQNYYGLLGVSENGTISEIKKAYKQLARKYHPDVSPPGHKEEYTKMFIKVQEAYETLSDPKSRAFYDRDMARGSELDLDSIFSGKRTRSSSGFGDRNEWEQRWQSQLSELIRKSNAKEFENITWGEKMRSQRSYCHS